MSSSFGRCFLPLMLCIPSSEIWPQPLSDLTSPPQSSLPSTPASVNGQEGPAWGLGRAAVSAGKPHFLPD